MGSLLMKIRIGVKRENSALRKGMCRSEGRIVSLVLIVIFLLAGVCQGKEGGQINKDSLEERIAIGRQIYRQGVLANGEPVEAYVMGDVKVLGTQFTCLNCHGRSGMGGAEGKTFTLEINPAALFSPRDSLYLERSAYDERTLEIAIRQGETPEGTALTQAMPVYDLPDRELAALLTYLKILSSDFSPGLTGEDVHIATVISDRGDPKAQKAMLAVMESYFKDKNAKTRYENKRLTRGIFYQNYRLKAYRQWVLHVWELQGPPETWTAQLEAYYEQQPVFAMLGGMVPGTWEPIHAFCEKNEIPSLLPNTDHPDGIGTDDFYTLYFSEGLHLEARVIAADLAGQKKPTRVLQVFRPEQKGAFGASSFRETVARIDGMAVAEWALKEGARFTRSELLDRVKEEGAEAVVVWLPPDELEGVNLEGTEQVIADYIYLSSSLLGGIFSHVPPTLGKRVKLVHPFVLPQHQKVVFSRAGHWFKNKNIPTNNHRIVGQTYYACMILAEGFMHIKRHFYRDYLLDALDHRNAKSIYSVNYPRLSFGPGQRYLAKGAFIIENPESGGKDSPAPATWIVPHL
jgi:hypothetical protein